MKYQFNLRPVNINDARAIATIGYNTWQDTYKGLIPDEFLDSIELHQQIAQCEEVIKKGASIIVASNVDNLIVGYCSFGVTRDPIHKNEFEIYSIYVSKETRSCGLGGILLFEVERRMSTLKPILVRTLKDNVRSRKFLENNGYRYIPGRDGVFRDVAPDVAYVKPKI